MGRVKCHRHVELATGRHNIGRKALMIFHITRALIYGPALKFIEQIRWIFPEDIHQHIQTTAMGHTKHDLLRTVFTGPLHQLIKRRNQALAALQTKTFSARILGIKMFFQTLCRSQAFKKVSFNVVFKRRVAVIALNSLLYPLFLFEIDDMHELIAN